MKVVSLFSGAGGLDLGLKSEGFDIVWANEYDKYASETYRLNFGDHLVEGDISEVDLNVIPSAEVLVGGFPCQPFSLAGYKKGFEDSRGELFWNIIKVANKTKPSVIILENVKNLVSHDKGNTFNVITQTLEKNGYYIKHKILTSYKFKIPQTRERIFIVAFKYKKHFNKFNWPTESDETPKFESILSKDDIPEKYFYRGTRYNSLFEEAGTDSVLQIRRHYVRKNASKMFPTLTANMGMGGHNVPIIFDKNVKEFRKITPREAFNLQGFPKDFKFPEGMSDSRLYKQAGNAVTVNVSKALAKKIKEAIND